MSGKSRVEAKKVRQEAAERQNKRYPIEKNVPLPQPKIRKTVKPGAKTRCTLIYPLAKMKIGDSFFVPQTDGATYPNGVGLVSAIQHYIARHPELMFSTRKTKRGDVEGYRVWRIPRRWRIGDA